MVLIPLISADRTPKQNLSGVIIEVTTEQGAEWTSQKGGTRFEARVAGAQVTHLIGTLSCRTSMMESCGKVDMDSTGIMASQRGTQTTMMLL